VNQGVFHETLNLAGLFDLPVVFIIENNQFGMGTSVERASAFRDHLAQRAEGYNIDWDLANGWDIYQLRSKLNEARERALKHSRPTVLEISTYRFFGFTIADASHKRYRKPEDIEFHKTHRDPVENWKNQLISEEILTSSTISEINKAAKLEAAQAIEFAERSSSPSLHDLTRHVYWECDQESPASRQGRYFFNDDLG